MAELPPKRMSSEERRKAIVEAVIPLFASKGFEGVTTRELANAADVSEALLYRHFPSKESLYVEIQNSICNQLDAKASRLGSLEPSTATLVFIAFVLVRGPTEGIPGDEIEHAILKRILMHSLLEDGDFARTFLEGRISKWMPKICECYTAAVASGDVHEGGLTPSNAIWLTHHLAVGVSTMWLPTKPAVRYETDRATLLREAAVFALRGIGLKEDAIHKHYQPEVFLKFFEKE